MAKINNVKLVIADIDNTLVKKRSPLSPLAKQAIEEMNKRGIYFALGSGRNVKQLHTLEETWGIKCECLVGMNGCELYDGLNDETEQLYTMKKEWTKEAFKLMKPFNYNAHAFINGVSLINRFDADIQGSAKFMKDQNMKVAEDESEFWSADTTKIGFRVTADEMPKIEKAFKEHPNKNFVGLKTEFTMFEVFNKEASKGKALELFCQRNNIDMANVMAVGDMTNDISMLDAAGIAVCMQNGSDDTKAHADYITEKTCDEDGFAHFIYDYILND